VILATRDNILSLPRNLTSLSLTATNGISSFAKALLEQPYHFAQLKRLSLTKSPKDDFDSRNVDFKDTLPRGLQRLKIRNNWAPHYITSPEFLPPSLTHLDIDTSHIDVLEGHGFPSTLTKIRVKLWYLRNIDWMKLLPAGLLECHIEPCDSSESSASYDWTSLPRGLTALFVFMGDDKVEAHHLMALPPSITNLYLDAAAGIDTDLLPLLPPLLKTLDGCLSHHGSGVVDPETAKKFPRSLTDLHRNVQVYAVPFLPPCLTCLRLQNSVDEDLLAPLPRSLKTLEMIEMPKASINQSFYPPTLTSLMVTNTIYKTEFFSAFPPTLSKLVLSEVIDCTDLDLMAPLKQLSSLIALTTLQLSFYSKLKLTSESSSWLPRSLEHLILRECEMESDWFSSLPSRLINLTLQVPVVKSDAMRQLERCCPQLSSMLLVVNLWDYKGPEPNPTVHCLLNLPPSLTECRIEPSIKGQASFKFATNDHLRQLPSSLTTLQIPLSQDVTSGCLPSFPKSLTTLILGYAVPRWFIKGLKRNRRRNACQ
jgi:hypothetical protein